MWMRDHKSRKENANERILNIDTTEQQKSQPQHPEKVKRLTAKTKGLYLSV
jgi:hypothetical protein|nr:MAG TPA: hypothetical protein [Caudoviricetes sp.]